MYDEPGFPRVDDSDAAALALYHAVYCSRAADGVNRADVDRIVASSRRQNPAHGITGVLVFGSGVFFQWLEGPRAAIQKLIEVLHADPRHFDIVFLSQGEEVRERLYPGWDMEEVAADDIVEVLEDALESADDPNNVAALTRTLEQLRSSPLDSVGRG